MPTSTAHLTTAPRLATAMAGSRHAHPVLAGALGAALGLATLGGLALLAACSGGDDTGGGGAGATITTSQGGHGGGTGGTGANGGTGGTGANGGTGGAPPVTELVHLVGRFDLTDPAAPGSTWPLTSMSTRIDGTGLDVNLDGAGGVYFQVEVDGSPTTVFQTSGGPQSYPVVSGLASGQHDIGIYRRNEGFFGVVQFVGFTATGGGTMIESPRPYQHRIEFIGDSLTCGYGIEGADQYCSFSGDTESAYLTYAAVASRATAAEPHIIAYSGKGVFQNYGGDTTEPMPELYGRTLTDSATPAWSFSSWIADAVVVNLGTNDFSATIAQSDFVNAYVTLLGTIRSYYPSAMIFCVSWADWGAQHEQWVVDAMTQSGDANTRHLSFAIDPADGYGCDGHTSITTNQKLGAQLAQALGSELGW